MSQLAQPSVAGISFRRLVDRNFYLAMALVMGAAVFYGFSHTVEANLLRPAVPRPPILYLHVVVFVMWLAMFTLQAALVRSRNIVLHKRLGVFGAGLGTVVFLIGVATTMVMTRFHAQHAEPGAPPLAFAIIPFNDMVAFAGCFGAAILLRRKPDYHRRLMLIATAALTAAGWGRFPQVPPDLFYLGVDGLILLGMARDLVVMRRVHQIYLYALPPIVAGQVIAMMVVMQEPGWWMAVVRAIAGI